jgi:hypothetical protein
MSMLGPGIWTQEAARFHWGRFRQQKHASKSDDHGISAGSSVEIDIDTAGPDGGGNRDLGAGA